MYKSLKKVKSLIWNFFKKEQFVIVLKRDKNIIGLIRVISKKVVIGKERIKVACLTSVGVRKIYRKKGYGRILLNKSIALLRKDFDAALLIARKKLDFFYDKFGFIGNSEFCEMKIKLQKKFQKVNLRKSTFNIVNRKLYSDTFSKSSGYFKRDKNDWKFVKFKVRKFRFKFISILNNKKREVGYIIYKNNTIFEYALDKKYIKTFYNAIMQVFSGFLIIKNPVKCIINYFQKHNEIQLFKRYCLYGGHMINFFKKKKLNDFKYNINYLDEF